MRGFGGFGLLSNFRGRLSFTISLSFALSGKKVKDTGEQKLPAFLCKNRYITEI